MVQNSVLDQVIQIVLGYMCAEKIALIGYIDNNGKPRSPFKDDFISFESLREANILVITKDHCQKSVLSDTIEQKCRAVIPVNCCILTLHEFTCLCQEGSVFINTIIRSDAFIYDKASTPVKIAAVPVSTAFIERTNSEISSWYNFGVIFLDMACSRLCRSDSRMTTCCLHQAIEQFLVMIIQAETGYRLGAHNILKLLRFLRFYNRDVADLLAGLSGRELHSLQILRDAYINTRYRLAISVTDENVHYLMKIVNCLQGIAERLLQQKARGSWIPLRPEFTLSGIMGGQKMY